MRFGVQTAAATATVGASMAKASEAMAAIGRTNDPQKMAATMQQFAKENAKMDLGQEMMDDSLDSALDEDGAEEETDDLMNQVGCRAGYLVSTSTCNQYMLGTLK